MVIDIVWLLCGNISDKTKNTIRQVIIIVFILSCTLLPRYRYDTVYDIIISVSFIVLFSFFLLFILELLLYQFVMMMKWTHQNPSIETFSA